jgi:hypothetical protein
VIGSISRLEHRLPKHILTASEADQVINGTDAASCAVHLIFGINGV